MPPSPGPGSPETQEPGDRVGIKPKAPGGHGGQVVGRESRPHTGFSSASTPALETQRWQPPTTQHGDPAARAPGSVDTGPGPGCSWCWGSSFWGAGQCPPTAQTCRV